MENSFHNNQKIAEQIATLMQQGEINSPDELSEWLINNKESETAKLLSSEEKLEAVMSDFFRKEKYEQAKQLVKRIEQKERKRRLYFLSSAAAAIAVVSFLVFQYSKENEVITDKKIAIVNHDDSNVTSPVIVFENGDRLDLQAEKKKEVDGTLISIGEDNKTKYTPQTKISKTTAYNTLIVPKASTYSVTLADGTVVSLNASSRLRFPVTFVEDQRVVYLEGEGYFDVAKDEKRPFIVNVNNINVKVYGTKFNLNGYNKSELITVLVEGRVGLKSEIFPNEKEIVLSPNQLSKMTSDHFSNQTVDIDPSEYVAWVDGYFIFKNKTIYNIAKELSRWYDVDFYFEESAMRDDPIVASICRSTELNDILQMLEKIATIKFIQDGRKIIVK